MAKLNPDYGKGREGQAQKLNPPPRPRNQPRGDAERPPRTDPDRSRRETRSGSDFEDPETGDDGFFWTYDETLDESVLVELHQESFSVTVSQDSGANNLLAGGRYVVVVDFSGEGSFTKFYGVRVTPDCTATKIRLSYGLPSDVDTLVILIDLPGDTDAGAPPDVQLDIILEGFFWTAGVGSATAVAYLLRGIGETVSSPSQITANQNDYALGLGTIQRLSTDASRNITGFVATFSGDRRTLINVGTQNIVVTNQDAASSANNRTITGTGASVTLLPDESLVMVYDGTTARWRVL